MSKNFTAKTSPKWILWSIITAVIVIAGIIVMVFATPNNAAHTKPGDSLIVNVSMSSTFYEDEKSNIQTITETAIKDAGLKAIHSYEGEKSLQAHELVYTFDLNTGKLAEVKNALQKQLDDEYPTYNVTVMVSRSFVLEKLPGGYVQFLLRNVAAGLLMAVLASVYVCLRYKPWNGIVTFVSAGATGALTAALAILTRAVVTTSVMYAVLLSVLLSLGLSVLIAAKSKKAEKENGALTDPEALSEAIPVCDVLKICGGLAAAMIVLCVVGLFTAANFAWFALVSIFGVIAAAYAALVLGPSVYLLLRKAFAKMEAERSRYDYKKGKKSKKAEKADEPKAEAAETEAK